MEQQMVTTIELCQYLNLTKQALMRLATQGVLKQDARNTWDLQASVTAYVNHLTTSLAETANLETALTQAQVAAILGVSPRRLRQRNNEPNPPIRNNRGQFPCADLGNWLREEFGNKAADDSFEEHKRRLTKAQADKAELEADVLRIRLVPAEVVASDWAGVLSTFRSRCLSIPTKAAQSVLAAATVAEAEHILKETVYETLQELSQYEPPSISQCDNDGDADSSTAADVDGK